MEAPATTDSPTAGRILDVAERLVQTHGFNGFSYADVAPELKMKKASLHYHFATKAELGTRLIERYHERFQAALDEIAAGEDDALAMLTRYVALYTGVLRKNRMCLCGMMAADYATLPKAMKARVRQFFDANEAWLARVLELGRRAKTVRFTGPPIEVARMILGALEGAMLIARSFGEVARFEMAAGRLLADLRAK